MPDSLGSWAGTAYGGYSFSQSGQSGIVLDGKSGYVDLGNRTFGGATSWAVWALLNNAPVSGWPTFFDWGSAQGRDNVVLAIWNGAMDGQVFLNPGGGGDRSATTSFSTAGVWAHYALTVDAAGNGVCPCNQIGRYCCHNKPASQCVMIAQAFPASIKNT